jgi:hypothetical protein
MATEMSDPDSPFASRIPNQFNKHRHSTELIYTTPTLGPKDAFNY